MVFVKELRSPPLMRSIGLFLPLPLSVKLFKMWDPSLEQGGQFLIERVASTNCTLGPTINVDP